MASIAASQHGCAGSSPRMTKETVRIRMECAVERGGSASSSATEQLLKIYISCIYLGSGIVKAPIFIDEKDVPEMRKMYRRRELFPAVKAVREPRWGPLCT